MLVLVTYARPTDAELIRVASDYTNNKLFQRVINTLIQIKKREVTIASLKLGRIVCGVVRSNPSNWWHLASKGINMTLIAKKAFIAIRGAAVAILIANAASIGMS